ncbi:hypothetical protein O3P69_017157 [Scylla paramamosain]|uniref:Uncharacterized protein n=1 Tax=Scylla paramamosain TaxID=85552 RepID=A0AAW0TW08_SCYPA
MLLVTTDSSLIVVSRAVSCASQTHCAAVKEGDATKVVVPLTFTWHQLEVAMIMTTAYAVFKSVPSA